MDLLRSSTKINLMPQLIRTTSFYLVSLGYYDWVEINSTLNMVVCSCHPVCHQESLQWLWWDREHQAGNRISQQSSSGQVDTWPCLSFPQNQRVWVQVRRGVSWWIWGLSGARVEQDRGVSTDCMYAMNKPVGLHGIGKENTCLAKLEMHWAEIPGWFWKRSF